MFRPYARLASWLIPCVFFSPSCGSDKALDPPEVDASSSSGSGDAGERDAAAADTIGDAAAADAMATGDDARADSSTPDVMPVRGLYVGKTGLDENPGTREAPLRSIATALSRAGPGDTVWLLEGTYDDTSDPRLGGSDAAPCGGVSGIEVPAGVTLAAAIPGTVTISVSGSWGLCLKGATVRDIDFRHHPNTGRMVQAVAGDNVIEGAAFANAYCGGGSGWEAAVSAINDARLTLRPGRVTNFLASGCKFLTVFDRAEVTIEGGSIVGEPGGTSSGTLSLLTVRDQSRLIMKGTTVASERHSRGFLLAHQATVVLEAGTVVRGFSEAGILNNGDDTRLQAVNTTFEQNGSGIVLPYGFTTKMTATLMGSTFRMNMTGIATGFGNTLDLTLTGSTFTSNRNGASLLGLGSVRVTDCHFTGNTDNGLALVPQNMCALTLRGSRFVDNNGAGVRFNCNAASTIDLGTLASPGGNTFTGNMPGVFATANITFDAIGNTWMASVQGANAMGRYEATGSGAVVEVTGGAGPNYQLGTSRMRVAANP